MTASQSSSDSSSSGRNRPMPALLTRTRGAPRSRLTNVANRSTAAGSDTSHGMPIASTPAAQKSPTVRRTFVSLRAQLAPRAPAPPSVIAIARPMPSVAPVTTAREPARSMAGQIYEGTGTGWRFRDGGAIAASQGGGHMTSGLALVSGPRTGSADSAALPARGSDAEPL